MRRLLVATAILMVIPAVARAGGGGVDTSGCAGYSEGTEVVMKDSCFAGTAHFAPTDNTITVTNDGQLPHTLTAVDGSFDTGQVTAGSSAQLSVDEPGIYRVFCSLHGTAQGDGMAGVLVVGAAEPASVAAASDTPARSAVVGSDIDEIVPAIDGEASAPVPQVIAVAGEASPSQLVVLLMVGLATGLGLAALLTVLRIRIADESSGRIGRFEPSVES